MKLLVVFYFVYIAAMVALVVATFVWDETHAMDDNNTKTANSLDWAGEHPWLWALIVLPLWPLSIVVALVVSLLLAVSALRNHEDGETMFAIAIFVVAPLALLSLPMVGFMSRQKRQN